TEPLFHMRAVEGPMSLDELLGRFDELARGVDHFEAYWFPHTRTCLTKANSRLAPGTPLDRLTRWREWAEDELLSNTVFGLAQRVGRISPRAIPSLSRISARALGPRSFTDLSHRVFTSPRRVRFKEMEYALPREATVPVLGELVDSLSRSELRISFPIEIRVAPADDILLSTASGRDSAYVAVHVDHASPHQPYFSLVESIMTAVGGRPHWGKLHTLRAGDLRPRYPAFDRFVALRDRLDPEGRFTNTYLDRVLGPPPGSG
ncbi:MAG: D-arabinono-1,4-lactone oxidase, partial [Acidimicrobiales bacterium]